MKIETKPFAKALNIAADTIERRNTTPILSAAKVEHRAENDRLIVTGTDLDMIVQASAPYTGKAFAPFTINNPRAFAQLFVAGAEEIELEEADGLLQFRGGRMIGKAPTLPADDFPMLPYSSAGMFQTSLGFAQLDMILRVAGACSTEETRYYLNGVYLHHVTDWTWKAVATDGHRLYVGTLELPDWQGAGIGTHMGGAYGSGGIIIPRRFIQLLRQHRRHMDPAAEIIAFAARTGPKPNQEKTLAPEKPGSGDTAARFGMTYWHGKSEVNVVTKLVDGTFPDYTRVIPTIDPEHKKILFRKADMQLALRAITAGASEKTRAVKLTFEKAGKLRVSSRWVDLGFEGSIEIDAKTNVAEPFDIGYNALYLRNILDVTPSDEIAIDVADHNSPGTIVSPGGTDFQTVLMPMRV